MVFLSSPHMASAGDEEPDFLDRPMPNSPRGLMRAQLKVSHPPTFQAKEDSNVRSIRRDSGTFDRKILRFIRRHAGSSEKY
jgi:hypothetical protein